MKNNISFCLCLFAVAAYGAVSPVIENFLLTQDRVDRIVTLSYKLTAAPAVVTLSVETNAGNGVWVKVPAEVWTAAGDSLGTLQQPSDVQRTFKWRPYRSWPGKPAIPTNECRAVLTAWATNAPPDYMVVDPTGTRRPHYYVTADEVPGGVTDNRYKSQYILMRRIHAAGVEWRMGSAEIDGEENQAWAVPHPVVLTSDFYIGVYETTQGQYVQFSGGSNPSKFGSSYADHEYRPVENLTATGYDPINAGLLTTIGTLASQTGVAFTLPTEAQWEFAARGGKGTTLPDGRTNNGYSAHLDAIAVWNKSAAAVSGLQTAVVGTKEPNAYGLYDVIGNVWEICRDGWKQRYSDNSPAVDPCVPDSESEASGYVATACKNGTAASPGYHSRRGGSYELQNITYLRVCGRYACDWRATWWGAAPGCGFRLCAPCEAR